MFPILSQNKNGSNIVKITLGTRYISINLQAALLMGAACCLFLFFCQAAATSDNQHLKPVTQITLVIFTIVVYN